MKYKTNAKCGGCTAAMTSALARLAPADAWKWDLSSPDKTLEFVGPGPEPEPSAIISAIEKAGFKASLLS